MQNVAIDVVGSYGVLSVRHVIAVRLAECPLPTDG
jgi:hypothetical protein